MYTLDTFLWSPTTYIKTTTRAGGSPARMKWNIELKPTAKSSEKKITENSPQGLDIYKKSSRIVLLNRLQTVSRSIW